MPNVEGPDELEPRVELREEKLDAVLAPFDRCQMPGMAVGIAVDGRPVYRRGFGLANLELPLVLTSTTRMRVGATTNQFTALAYLLLCEEGRASTEDTIGAILPELPSPTSRIKVSDLLGHTSGLRDPFDLSFYFSGMDCIASSEELLATYRSLEDVNAPPGYTWSYNHGGYLLISAAIERLTNKSLEEVFAERIFAPLGMHDTSLRRVDGGFLDHCAILHSPCLDGGFERARLRIALAGEGGMVSTVDDMLRWLAHMDSPQIGNAHTWHLMKTPRRLTNGRSTGYGFGLMSGRYRGQQILWHVAGLWGGSAQALKLPERGLDVVVLVNRGDVWAADIAERIVDACVSGLDPRRSEKVEGSASGLFKSLSTGTVVQLYAAGERQMAAINGADLPFAVEDGCVLRSTGPGRYVDRTIELDADVRSPRVIRLREFGNADELVRLGRDSPDDIALSAGYYRSESTGIEATIRAAEVPVLTTLGRHGSVEFELEWLGERTWRARSKRDPYMGGVLSFDDGERFLFSTDRTRSLPFRRAA